MMTKIIDSNEIKEIKKAILYSGIPLEISTSRELNKLFKPIPIIFEEGDYSFNSETTHEKINATSDIIVRNFIDLERFELLINFIIECKYRNPDVNWIFFKGFSTTSSADEYSLIESRSDSHSKVIEENIEKVSETMLDLCKNSSKDKMNRAVETYKNKNEEKSERSRKNILDVMEQVMKATIGLKKNNIDNFLIKTTGKSVISICLPMIVTTANLFVVKEGDMETINNLSENNQKNYLKEVDSLVFDYKLPFELFFNFDGEQYEENAYVTVLSYKNIYKYMSCLKEEIENKLKENGFIFKQCKWVGLNLDKDSW